jgi:hypothetical protein
MAPGHRMNLKYSVLPPVTLDTSAELKDSVCAGKFLHTNMLATDSNTK